MTTMAAINDFLAQKTLAVVGVSKNEKKFSHQLYKKLKTKGYRLFPVNPTTQEIAGEPCYPTLQSLPQPVDGVVILVPPQQTEKVVEDAKAAGIPSVWMQQGAESQKAIDFCQKNGIQAIHHQCLLMFADPTGFPHNFHRSLKKLFGKLPQ